MIYPAFVYKAPGSNQCQGGSYDYSVVNSNEERAELLAAGWYDSVPEALEGKHAAPPDEIADDNSAPTREELEAKAKELGISFDGRTSDSKLAAKIDEALKG